MGKVLYDIQNVADNITIDEDIGIFAGGITTGLLSILFIVNPIIKIILANNPYSNIICSRCFDSAWQ